jgi:hypothetical protein
MPQSLQLTHDYVAWHEAALESRSGAHHDDWETVAPRLRDFPPGEMVISDPHDVCGTMVGKPIIVMTWNILGWDMDSPVARGALVAVNA